MSGIDAQRAMGQWHGAGEVRAPVLLIVLLLHAVFLGGLLLSHVNASQATQPVPLQMAIINAPQAPPESPPLQPLAPQPPRVAIEVPAPLVSIPDPVAMTATVDPAPTTVAATTALVTNATPTQRQPVTAPRFDAAYLHNPPPEYPAAARRMHEQGAVLLRVRVSGAGTAEQVLVEHSSGSRRLDEAATQAVERWRFVPAHSGTEPVEAWVLVPVEFGLRR